MGKAILAFLPEKERDDLLDRLELKKFASKTIVDRDELVAELLRTRERGYAIDDNEMEDNVRCVGAPIFDHMRRPIAAMSVSGPAYRMTLERLEELSFHIVEFTQAISRQLGYIPDMVKLDGQDSDADRNLESGSRSHVTPYKRRPVSGR
jgi:DNA-binding IclR family transcriptional regulator